MTVKELKEKIKNLPDDMPVVYTQDDNPDLANVENVNVILAHYVSVYGYIYHYVNDSNCCKQDKPIKVFLVNASCL